MLQTETHPGMSLVPADRQTSDAGAGTVYALRSMAASAPQPALYGRRRECDAMDRLLACARAGQSRALVVRGEAGVGKTALLDHLCQSATGCRVARATGVESEMELAFAGLHQLCAPFLGHLPRLPGPQVAALEIAFGLRDGAAPDRYRVGLAVLSLLSEAAAERPVVCAVDDAQWLDRASGQALAFVARRLAAESVALVLAAREPSDGEALTGLEEMVVLGLGHDDAGALLDSALTGPLDDRVRNRIVAETRGNPLALLELPRGLSIEELAGGFGLARWPGVPAAVQESFARRVEALPEQTRLLLLLAAADPLGDPLLLWRAAARLDIALAVADPVDTDGLLTIGEQVVFRHPLVRTVVYRGASAHDRRSAHLALAQATDPDADPARRAWHLAAAASGPDDEVALELERSAAAAQARGGLAAAASFLRRSVALTADPDLRAERALAAADASLRAGAFDAALRVLATAEARPLGELQRARVGLLRAQARSSQSRGDDGARLLLDAAEALEPLDPMLARDTYLDAWGAALFSGEGRTRPILHAVARQALTTAPAEGSTRPADLLLEGFSRALIDGRRAATPVLKHAADRFCGGEVSAEELLRWGWLATAAAVMVWDFEACVNATTRGVQAARDAGALTMLPVGLTVLAQFTSMAGDLRRAASLVAEARAVADATGAEIDPHGALVLAGFRGNEIEAVRFIDETIARSTAAGRPTAVRYAQRSAAMLFNGLGRYDLALDAARDAAEGTAQLSVSSWVTIELVEAAVRAGAPKVARDALDQLAESVDGCDTDWARGIDARLRALVHEGAGAEGLYREAIDRLSRTPLRPDIARAHLLYGEWLRRESRRVDARMHLRIAHELFVTIRMDAFAERARRELIATGERVRRRSVETIDDLTAQETEISRLAAAGRSNPEIAAQLFLSPRTVEWHLRKVFIKLGISSRRELAGALGEPDHLAALA